MYQKAMLLHTTRPSKVTQNEVLALLIPTMNQLVAHFDYHRPGDKKHFPPNFFWIPFLSKLAPLTNYIMDSEVYTVVASCRGAWCFDAWFWLFWRQNNINEFLRSTRTKIITLGPHHAPPPKNVGRLISEYMNREKSTIIFALAYYNR